MEEQAAEEMVDQVTQVLQELQQQEQQIQAVAVVPLHVELLAVMVDQV
jgi:hypothetical protein